jgi:50S ribosomal subunit-associated GTPase HflX
VLVSARTEAGLDALRLRIIDRLGLSWRSVRLHLAPHDRASLAAVYRLGRVRSHEVEEDGVHLQAEVPAWLAERLRGSIV